MKNGRSWRFYIKPRSAAKDGWCNQCRLPGAGWENGGYWIDVSDYKQDCKDKNNRHDLCSCAPGKPPKLVVEKNSEKKGLNCLDPATGRASNYRVGNEWPCYLPDMK